MRTRTLASIAGLLLLLASGCASPGAGNDSSTVSGSTPRLTQMTLDQILWADDPRLPDFIRENNHERPLRLIGHVKEWHGFPAMKQFTMDADPLFVLSHGDRQPIFVNASTGGITSSDGKLRYVILYLRSGRPMDQSLTYELRPQNQTPAYQWKVECQVEPKAVPAGL